MIQSDEFDTVFVSCYFSFWFDEDMATGSTAAAAFCGEEGWLWEEVALETRVVGLGGALLGCCQG